MKKYTKHKTLLLCLILVSLLFTACKDKGNEEVKQPTATTTALEGTWVYSTNITTSQTMAATLVFSGANFSSATVVSNTAYPDPSDASIVGTETNTISMAGTFKINNNQILVTPTTASDITANTVDPSRVNSQTGNNALPTGYTIGQEASLGTFILNGNTLSLTSPGNSSALPFNKQQ